MSKSSMILGIVGICLGWLVPIIGLTLGIIGLAINKEKGHETRDLVLNIAAVGVSIIFWAVWMIIAA